MYISKIWKRKGNRFSLSILTKKDGDEEQANNTCNTLQVKPTESFIQGVHVEEVYNLPALTKFMIGSIASSLLVHKSAHLLFGKLESQERNDILGILFLPQIFLCDIAFFVAVLYIMKKCHVLYTKEQAKGNELVLNGHKSKETNSRIEKVARIFFCVMTVLLFFIAAVETQTLVTVGEYFPWDMTLYVLQHFENFKGMMGSKTVGLEGVICVQLFLTGSIAMAATPIARKTTQKFKPSLAKNTAFMCIAMMYIIAMFVLRPTANFSHTPIISVPYDIFFKGGIHDNDETQIGQPVTSHETKAHIKNFAQHSSAPKIGNPLNVVLIMLETMRYDMMPFDATTEWAKKFILNENAHTQDITPFYSTYVKNPNVFYVPKIKSASGFTHKSITSIFCSLYPIPQKMTREHRAKLYHKCVPHLLCSSGDIYQAHRHFKPLTSWFDYQTELMANIGFTIDKKSKNESKIEFYGENEFNDAHKDWDKRKRENHRANYFGYEDMVLLDPIKKWVGDRVKENQMPFFMSYLSGVTHDPYDYPPKNYWKRKRFSADKKMDGFLNAVAYTDKFLEDIMTFFKSSGLMNSTLFVIMGDHGVNLKNRGDQVTTFEQTHEEAFDVGVSFYTEHEETAKRMKIMGRNEIMQNATWSSIDIVPSILDLLEFSADTVDYSLAVNELFDGRSMLRPKIGGRLSYSNANPGDRVVLRDGSFLIIVPNKEVEGKVEVYDMVKDPMQLSPLFLDSSSPTTHPQKELFHWGKQALKFVHEVNRDLIIAHRSGKRCEDCALSKSLYLETLSQWEGYEALPE